MGHALLEAFFACLISIRDESWWSLVQIRMSMSDSGWLLVKTWYTSELPNKNPSKRQQKGGDDPQNGRKQLKTQWKQQIPSKPGQ